MITGLVVLKMVLMPSSAFLATLANSGPRWSMTGVSIARRTRSGTGVGPGICRKCRPTARDEFFAIDLAPKSSGLGCLAWLCRPRGPGQGAALVALNYECNIAVKRFSAHQLSHSCI